MVNLPSKLNKIWYLEGKAKFRVGRAFYRPEAQLARDLGVLAAAVYKAETGSLRVLDAMSGCGVRSLRYWLESKADWVWANEGNPEISSILEQNLQEAIDSGCCRIEGKNAHQIFFDCYSRQDYYDLVDVDSFGSVAPFLSTVFWATKIGGSIYLTSTDGRTGTGHLPENSLKDYGAYARSHPAAHEQALRLLIGRILQQAATQGWGVKPIFSLFAGQTYRVMVRLVAERTLTSENYGFLAYCPQCGRYQTVSWRKLGMVICQKDNSPLTLSGPMWLGELHDRSQLAKMRSLALTWNWQERANLLEIMAEEADLPPYFYTLGEIGRKGKMDVPKRSLLIQALLERGYRASATHINAQAIKTDAAIETCIAVARILM